MVHSHTVQTMILATGSALALISAALGDHAQAESSLDASYTISFARIRVGDITATVVFGDTEYAMSARGLLTRNATLESSRAERPKLGHARVVAFDGEVETRQWPLIYRTRPGALRVFAPAAMNA
jgi:hypothetical protein